MDKREAGAVWVGAGLDWTGPRTPSTAASPGAAVILRPSLILVGVELRSGILCTQCGLVLGRLFAARFANALGTWRRELAK